MNDEDLRARMKALEEKVATLEDTLRGSRAANKELLERIREYEHETGYLEDEPEAREHPMA